MKNKVKYDIYKHSSMRVVIMVVLRVNNLPDDYPKHHDFDHSRPHFTFLRMKGVDVGRFVLESQAESRSHEPDISITIPSPTDLVVTYWI
jgi:hypothetical protein